MKCPTCGEQIEQGATFCANCGSRVPAAESSAGKQTVLLSNPYDAAPAPNPRPTVGEQDKPTQAVSTPSAGANQPYTPPAYTPPAYTMPSSQTPYSTYTSVPNHTLAIVSLVFGILGIIQILPLIGPVVAVITGHMARRAIRDSQGQFVGNGMAMAGLIMGYLMLVVYVIGCILFLLFFIVAGASFSTSP